MTRSFHQHVFSKKASHWFVVFCTFLLVLALIAAFVSFFIPKTAVSSASIPYSYPIDAAGYKTATLTIGTTTISVEIADTDALQEQGLSDRMSLDANKGMLFVFPTDQAPEFWMKDMHFPLDIIWLDVSGEVIDITHDLSPNSYPSTVSPDAPVRYVLEVNAGFAALHSIDVGTLAKVD